MAGFLFGGRGFGPGSADCRCGGAVPGRHRGSHTRHDVSEQNSTTRPLHLPPCVVSPGATPTQTSPGRLYWRQHPLTCWSLAHPPSSCDPPPCVHISRDFPHCHVAHKHPLRRVAGNADALLAEKGNCHANGRFRRHASRKLTRNRPFSQIRLLGVGAVACRRWGRRFHRGDAHDGACVTIEGCRAC